MPITYAQKSSTVPKAAAPIAASILDSSSQGESLQHKVDLVNRAAQRNVVKNMNRGDKIKALEDDFEKIELLNSRIKKEVVVEFLTKSNLSYLKKLPEDKFNRLFNFYYYSGGRNNFLNFMALSKFISINIGALREIKAEIEQLNAAYYENVIPCILNRTENLNEIDNNYLIDKKKYPNIENKIKKYVSKYEKLDELCKEDVVIEFRSLYKDFKDSPSDTFLFKNGRDNSPHLMDNEGDKLESKFKGLISYSVGRDHIIPHDCLKEFVRYLYINWNSFKDDVDLKEWIAAAVKVYFINNRGDDSIDDLRTMYRLVVQNDRKMLAHQSILKSLLWMPGNIFISWKIDHTARAKEDCDGKKLDGYAKEVFEESDYAKYDSTFNSIKKINDKFKNGKFNKTDDDTECKKIFKNLKDVAEVKLNYTTPDQWEAKNDVVDETADPKKKKKRKNMVAGTRKSVYIGNKFEKKMGKIEKWN